MRIDLREIFYLKRRIKSILISLEKKENVARLPEYQALAKKDEEAWENYSKALFSNNRKDTIRFSVELDEIKQRELEIIKNAGFELVDLEPQCICEKCQDRGFLENEEPCDCFNEEGKK